MNATIGDHIDATAGREPAEFASPQRMTVEQMIAHRHYAETITQREKRRRETIVRRIHELEAIHGAEADAVLDDLERCRAVLAPHFPRLAKYLGALTADRSRRMLLRSEVLKAIDLGPAELADHHAAAGGRTSPAAAGKDVP